MSPQWTPDVYVSFIASNEGKTFTSSLFKQLKRAGIGYLENYDQNDHYRQEAIRHARFAIIVFSANDANNADYSRHLNELVNILLRRGDSKYPSLVVIPIFRGIKPDKALKLQRKVNDVKKKEWGRALEKVGGIPGYDLDRDANGDDSKLIDEIVKRLFNEIWSLYSSKVFGPFGRSGEMSWLHNINEIKDFTVTFKVDRPTKTNPKSGQSIKMDPGKVKLEKDEHIISFSGYFQDPKHGGRIEALTFLTTRKNELRVGPTDQGREADFSVPLPLSAGKVIEFFGSKKQDGFLTSIGARVGLPPEVSCPVGLFGSRRGSKWDAKQHTTMKRIKAVRVSRGSRCIRSIAFMNDNDETWRPHGSPKDKFEEFKINGPDEYLSSISGCCTHNGIASLMFLTNKKRTKTIGDGKGTYFSSPTIGYEIVGFYGWSDERYLHGIGAYFKPISDLHLVKSIGPFGGGIAWDDGKFQGVKEVYVFEDDDISYIKIVYDDGSKDGYTVIHGGDTREYSNEEQMVELDYPSEYLISISGSIRDDGSIQSLTFHSNRKMKTFGDPKGGKYFGYPSNKSRIIGFYGTWGRTLNSIGVYVEPIPHWKTSECPSIEGYGGDKWEDGVHSNVVGFRVTQVGEGESQKIESITFMYENNGSLVEGFRHGGGAPTSGKWEMLNFPEERLLSIEGYHLGSTIIHNLTISTEGRSGTDHKYAMRGNPKSSGPEKKFEIPNKENEGRRIVGFFGTAGNDCLNFIGAHLAP